MKGYMYILECADGSYYTGSTKNLERRLAEHNGDFDSAQPPQGFAQETLETAYAREIIDTKGANYTRKRRPVILVYYEEFPRIDEAFYREKQVQNWSHAKKKALIENRNPDLSLLAKKDFSHGRLDTPPTAALGDRMASITEEIGDRIVKISGEQSDRIVEQPVLLGRLDTTPSGSLDDRMASMTREIENRIVTSSSSNNAPSAHRVIAEGNRIEMSNKHTLPDEVNPK
jgi:putative endonuclease